MSPEQRQDFAFAFLSILFEGAPFILLGTLISGIIDVYMPSGLMDRMLPKRKIPAVFVAGLLGIIFPVCECAVVPVIRRLVRKGLPVSCALTYMLAAPILNPITALSTWKAFPGANNPGMIPGTMTAARLGLGFAVAVLVGLVVLRIPLGKVLRPRLLESLHEEGGKQEQKHEHSCCGGDHHHHHHEHDACCGHSHEKEDHTSCCGGHPHEHAHTHAEAESSDNRLVAAFRSAMRDFIDVGVYFVIGVMITALFNTGIAPGAAWLDSLAQNHIVAPFALMALAFVLSLCSTSDAFIAATLAKFSFGAKLAFLVFGPMMDVKLIFLYQTVMRKRFIVALAIGLALVIGTVCILGQSMLNHVQP